MAGESNKKKTEKAKSEVNRGTTDEVEVLKLIISENRGLYLRVVDRIRTLRAASSETIFDKASSNQKDKNSNKKKEKK